MDDTTPPVSCIKFTPNSKYLLVGRMDDKIKLWDYSMSQCLKTYQGHVNKRYCLIFTICYSDDEQRNWIVSGSEDNAIYFWDIQTKDLVFKHENAHDGKILSKTNNL
jgi:COMPASS component SWD3